MQSMVAAATTPSEFINLRSGLISELLATEPFNAGTWQKLDVSESRLHDTYELEQLTILYPMPQDMTEAIDCIRPDLPWAEGHFLERVGGQPVNPGDWHDKWPYHAGQVQLHQNGGKYDHNYMERMWPTGVDCYSSESGNFTGYRFEVGDLEDVVQLLIREPHTRQAYLPIWFPEDTGAKEGQRVPCSLGYHFMIRNGQLHLSYYLRSCEAYRHFTNDVYMAVRLAQWVAERVYQGASLIGAQIASQRLSLGTLHMAVASFHGFVGDQSELEALIEEDGDG